MATHIANVKWERGEQDFLDQRYSRAHHWRFDGGAQVLGSSSPHLVRAPMSDPRGVDPEEAFVASLASCHMLWFLSLAAQEGFRVDRYEDDAEGVLEKGTDGRVSMTRVTLRPAVGFSGAKRPTPADIVRLHHRAHEECFIANSVKSEVRCEPRS